MDRKICLRVTVWHHKDFSIRTKQSYDRFFFLHTFRPTAYDFNVGVAMNKSYCFTWTSAILKVDVLCDVIKALRDLLYNQCIDNMCCYSFFICPTGRITVCKIRIVSKGENGRKPRRRNKLTRP